MTWQLSGAHLAAAFITHPRTAFYAACLREARRDVYRETVLRAHRTDNLEQRAVLQASAARLRRALYGSAAFDGAVIALLVEGDDEYAYDDGDSAPLHCTVCFCGQTSAMSPVEQNRIVTAARRIGEDFAPFDADVVSPAEFGETPVFLVEHPDINAIHDAALGDRTVRRLSDSNDEHPGYLPHVSGLDGRDTVRFDRVAAMLGGNDHVFPLTGTQTPDADKEIQNQGALT